MALWQFNCSIIPKKNMNMNTKLDEILSWRGIGVESLIKEQLQTILPQSKGWTKSIIQYGDTSSTCIELFLKETVVEEISMRLDLRSLTKEMLLKIIGVINELDGYILCNDKVYPVEMKILISLLKNSEAGKFTMDPQEYFENLTSIF